MIKNLLHFKTVWTIIIKVNKDMKKVFNLSKSQCFNSLWLLVDILWKFVIYNSIFKSFFFLLNPSQHSVNIIISCCRNDSSKHFFKRDKSLFIVIQIVKQRNCNSFQMRLILNTFDVVLNSHRAWFWFIDFIKESFKSKNVISFKSFTFYSDDILVWNKFSEVW